MEFFYLLLIALVIFYVNEFWNAHRSKRSWAVKRQSPIAVVRGDRVETVSDSKSEADGYQLSLRERKQHHIQRREAEAERKNRKNEEVFHAYENILIESLAATHYFDFNSLYDCKPLPVFSIPAELSQATPSPTIESYKKCKIMSLLSRFYPGHEKRKSDSEEEAFCLYQRALILWETAEENRITSLRLHKEEFERHLAEAMAHNENIQKKRYRLFESYVAGDEFVVAAYAKKILQISPYPKWLSRKVKTTYVKSSRQLIVDYDLPKLEVIPRFGGFRFVKSSDSIVGKERKLKDINDDYTGLISAIALKVLYEVFESDREGLIDVCCFNGYLDAIDRSVGVKVRPCLISTRTTKEKFQEIELAHVDARLCVRNLGSHVSGSVSDLQAVKPIIEFNTTDRRFVEQGDLSFLSSAQNLMDLTPSEFEKLIVKLFQDLGLDAKLTQASRDGGVDCVAYDVRPIIGGKVVIQAKRYRHTVGVSAVRDLYGTMGHEGANKGILVTTSGYGPDAFSFAKDKPIELIDGGGLLHYLREVGINARIVMPTE